MSEALDSNNLSLLVAKIPQLEEHDGREKWRLSELAIGCPPSRKHADSNRGCFCSDRGYSCTIPSVAAALTEILSARSKNR